MDSKKALSMAEDEGYDLVLIAPTAEPPVCRIMDYKKYCFEQEKKEKEARKRQQTVELKEIFRQSLESLIVTNAHRIVNGELPELSVRDNDFFFLNASDQQVISDTIRDLYSKRLPAKYGYSSLFDIQVIAPGK